MTGEYTIMDKMRFHASFPLLPLYVFAEFLPPFAVALFTFISLLLLQQLFFIMDLFLNRGVPVPIIGMLVLLSIPIVLPLAIPMAALLAGLVSYGRLSADGEITALRAAGCPHLAYLLPNLIFGILLSCALLYFNLSLAPKSRVHFENLRYILTQRNPLALFSPKVMHSFGEYKIMVEKMDRKKQKLTGVSIYKMNPNASPTLILAPFGEMSPTAEGDLLFSLSEGAIHQPSPQDEREYLITKFNRFSLRIPQEKKADPRQLTAREMNYTLLKEKMHESVQNHISPAPFQAEIHLRIAIACAAAIFSAVGILLGIQLKKGGRTVSIGVSLLLIIFYYGIFLFVVPIAAEGHLHPFLLIWLPNFFMIASAAFLWIRLAKL